MTVTNVSKITTRRKLLKAGLYGVAAAATTRRTADAAEVNTISTAAGLNGPKPASQGVTVARPAGGVGHADIAIDFSRRIGHINPLVYGACFEDLNHEIYGGLYAQMIYGESFEEGPEKELLPGWRYASDWMANETFAGQWWSENDAIGMVGFRWLRILKSDSMFSDGEIECELMQPQYDPGNQASMAFCAGGQDFRGGYAAGIDINGRQVWLSYNDQRVASRPYPVAADQWVKLRAKVNGKQIAIFVGDSESPILKWTNPHAPATGLVGFDATSSRGWFRRLKIMPAGRPAIRPSLTPARAKGWLGPVSQWWEPVATGTAVAEFAWDNDHPFNTLRSQRITLKSGRGRAGVANRGLLRAGLACRKGWRYEGRVYLRGSYGGNVRLELQSHDGATTLARQRVSGVEQDWKRFDFSLAPTATNFNARFVIAIDEPGTIWADQAVLMPAAPHRFAGQTVRRDLAEAVRKVGFTAIRMGGDFEDATGYRWKTMLGDPDKRPQYRSVWYPFETRGWSIVEFMAFCRAAGIEPIPALNYQESPDDVVDFIEFCNGDGTGAWSRQRVRMGYREPFAIRYFQYGNGFVGADTLAQIGVAAHLVDPKVRLLSGSIAYKASVLPPPQVLRTDANKMAGQVYGLSVYPYNDDFWGPQGWQNLINAMRPQIKGRLKIYSQEVNGGLHNLQRGLADAAYNCISETNSDIVAIVCYCGMLEYFQNPANGWTQGLIFFSNHEAWLQPGAWAISMARRAWRPAAVPCVVKGPTMHFDRAAVRRSSVSAAPAIVASASCEEDGTRPVIKIVNMAPFAVTAELNMTGVKDLGTNAKIALLTGTALADRNTAGNQRLIKPQTRTLRRVGPRWTLLLPAYSFTVVEFAGKT